MINFDLEQPIVGVLDFIKDHSKNIKITESKKQSGKGATDIKFHCVENDFGSIKWSFWNNWSVV